MFAKGRIFHPSQPKWDNQWMNVSLHGHFSYQPFLWWLLVCVFTTDIDHSHLQAPSPPFPCFPTVIILLQGLGEWGEWLGENAMWCWNRNWSCGDTSKTAGQKRRRKRMWRSSTSRWSVPCYKKDCTQNIFKSILSWNFKLRQFFCLFHHHHLIYISVIYRLRKTVAHKRKTKTSS